MRARRVLAVVAGLATVGGAAGPATGTATGTGAEDGRHGPHWEAEGKPAAAPTTPTHPLAEVTADELRFDHHTLRPGSPEEAGLLPGPVARLGEDLRAYLGPSPTRPLYAGGVVLASRRGVVAAHEAAGHALRYADPETELPAGQRVPATRDTIFDLASVTKTFTTIAVLQQVEDGRLDLDAAVASYLPAFAANGKQDVTVRHLLTHTGGLPAWLPLYSRYDTVEERLAAVLEVAPRSAPGERYTYSDLGLITLGLLVEEVTGRPLDEVVAAGITAPLGMRDTLFNPLEHDPALVDRIAATEAQPWAGRTMVRGEVHDENAWSLGGVAGHAGLFSTAHDLAVLARTLLNGGRYGTDRVLETETVRTMLADDLGFEVDERWYMDGLSTPVTFGHTGFTGTSLVVDPMSDSFVVLLTNRVHPSRDWGSNNPARRAVARDLARALAVRPLEGDRAWFSGIGDDRTVRLSTTAPAGARLDFGLWYDTEAGWDEVRLEASPDGGETWAPVPFDLRLGAVATPTDGTVSGFGGRRWHHASALLPAAGAGGPLALRWTYDTDGLYQGRGVYVDGVRLDGTAVDDARFDADGWSLSAD